MIYHEDMEGGLADYRCISKEGQQLSVVSRQSSVVSRQSSVIRRREDGFLRSQE
jgi:hypothetical protein